MKLYDLRIVLLVALTTTRVLAQEEGNGKMLEMGGRMVESRIAKDVLATMLESTDSEQAQAAVDVLRANVGVLILPSGELPHRLGEALQTYYLTLPAFPPDLHLSETNVMEIMRSPRVFVFSLLARSGGSRGEAVINAALQGEDELMREIATKQMRMLAQDASPGVTNRTKIAASGDVGALPDSIATVFSGESRTDKESLLREIRQRKRELRQEQHVTERRVIVSALKQRFHQEQSQSVREDLVTTIAALDEQRMAMSFLEALIDNPGTDRAVKSHAKYVRECLLQGVFR